MELFIKYSIKKTENTVVIRPIKGAFNNNANNNASFKRLFESHDYSLELGHIPVGNSVEFSKVTYWDGKAEADGSVPSGAYLYSD